MFLPWMICANWLSRLTMMWKTLLVMILTLTGCIGYTNSMPHYTWTVIATLLQQNTINYALYSSVYTHSMLGAHTSTRSQQLWGHIWTQCNGWVGWWWYVQWRWWGVHTDDTDSHDAPENCIQLCCIKSPIYPFHAECARRQIMERPKELPVSFAIRQQILLTWCTPHKGLGSNEED
jgi:hypothetical protein